jgi:FtsZ-binding cell division protein ZapB
MAPSTSSCVSLSSEIDGMEWASGDNHKWRRKCKELKEDKEAMALMRILVALEDYLQDKLMKRSKVKLTQCIISLFTRLCAYGEMNVEIKNSPLLCKSCDALCAENEKLKDETNCRNKHVEALRSACDNLDFENDELRSSLANLQSEIDLLKSNASMPCNSCVALNNDLDVARSKIALLETSASSPCASCESLLAEINELKLTHTTCVDELEHARVEICDMKFMPL